MNAKSVLIDLLLQADIQVNGKRRFDIQVHDERFYGRVLRDGAVGLGESYMDGWWDSEGLDETFYRVMRARLSGYIRYNWTIILSYLWAYLLNLQKGKRSWKVGQVHYDRGNDLYQAMLDRRMTYTCGYWKKASTLDEAQEAKLDLICRKLNLQPNQKILDVGCGWGSFMKYAAERYGVECEGLTVSNQQVELGRILCQGYPIQFHLHDYRDYRPNKSFDHIVSVGMFEHVGFRNYSLFMKKVHSWLKEDGLFLLHTIGSPVSMRNGDPWVLKYIFPNSMLPSLAQIGKAKEKLFMLEDLHNFGQDYDPTLMAWYHNFEQAWPELKQMSHYDERFFRMWRYFLLSCAGASRARRFHLWQFVFSPEGIVGGYQPVR